MRAVLRTAPIFWAECSTGAVPGDMELRVARGIVVAATLRTKLNPWSGPFDEYLVLKSLVDDAYERIAGASRAVSPNIAASHAAGAVGDFVEGPNVSPDETIRSAKLLLLWAIERTAIPAYAIAAAIAMRTSDLGTSEVIAQGATGEENPVRRAPPHPDAYFGAMQLWRALELDLEAVSNGETPLNLPLWHGSPVPEVIKMVHRDWRARGGGWVFWADWYEGYLTGRPLDIDLLEKVALIPSEDWDKGETHVNGVIDAIRRDHAIARTPNGEIIAVNPETGRLRIEVDTALPADIGTYARRKIRAAVEVFSSVQNQYAALASDLLRLRQAAGDPDYTPVELFDECAAASRRLASRIWNGEVPEAETDALIADYGHRIREAGADILANDPKTQELLTARARIAGTDAFVAEGAAVRSAVDLLLPVTEGLLAQRLPEDAETASDPAADPEDRKVASVKLASRLVRIAKVLAWAVGGTGATIIGTAEVLEALHMIQSSPIFQAALQAVYRFLGF